MKERLSGIVPDFKIHCKAELVFEINQIKEERATIILRHNHYPIEVEESLRIKAKQSIDRMLEMS